MSTYDAVLILGFGGPEKSEDVMPFLEIVTRGRNIPRARLEEVAANYYAVGGRSPINDQCRELIAALRGEMDRFGIVIPVYWGNRNWHPFLDDTMAQMAADGVRRALVFATSAYSSYSSCRQYLEDLDRAVAAIGPVAPHCDKIGPFYDRSGFVESLADRLRAAFVEIPEVRRDAAVLMFTAHSVPISMAQTSKYVQQLTEVASKVAQSVGWREYSLVWQSRSGPPHQPWLEPDVKDALTDAAARGVTDVVVQPIGFISDHMEVIVDLDLQAAGHARSLGLNMVRAATVGTHPLFVAMIRELIQEHLSSGGFVNPCLAQCCPSPHRLAQAAVQP